MDEADGSSVSVSEGNSGSRKRKHKGTERQRAKKIRYSQPRRALVFNPCLHNTNRFSCVKVRPRHLKKLQENYFQKPEKTRQDNIIGSLIKTHRVKRRRPRPVILSKKNKPGGEHAFNVSYWLPIENNIRVPVCKKFFLSVTGVGRSRLNHIIHRVHLGLAIEERRGGDRRSGQNIARKENVRRFIKNLRGSESHYNRAKSKRIYLQPGLSIRKLHTIYNKEASEELQMKCSMFRKIFVTEFNIGFKSPASDTCSTCCLLKEKIKKAAPGSHDKMQLMVEKRVHSQRAKAFYSSMKEEVPDSISFCFDLQQIQSLPKCPIQEAFYARQINFYNFCITDLATKNPQFYTWTEDKAGKGSLEISSALLHYLKITDLKGRSILRLFCDGCVSQNKNNIVLRTLIHFLQSTNTTIVKIIMTFPVRGHSFLPADRVFGRAEKILRKQALIISKEDYYDCYRQIGEVKIIGEDWHLKNTKSLSDYYKDIENISDLKRIVIKVKGEGNVIVNEKTKKTATIPRRNRQHTGEDNKCIVVKGMKNYRFESDEEQFVSLRKRGKMNLQNVTSENVPLGHPITIEKKNDVDKLLKKLFGNEWANDNNDERLEWYKSILFENPLVENEEDEVICDCLENERCELHI